MLRLPDGMRERIAAAAKANGRSMNAEIVSRLEGSLSGLNTAFSEDMIRDLKQIADRAIRDALAEKNIRSD